MGIFVYFCNSSFSPSVFTARKLKKQLVVGVIPYFFKRGDSRENFLVTSILVSFKVEVQQLNVASNYCKEVSPACR